MNKRITAIIIIILAISFTGCTARDTVDQLMNAQIKQQSGVTENPDYKTYIQFHKEGKLNSEGNYDPEVVEIEAPEGSIHVTFAANKKIDVNYYLDANHTVIVDTTACYINPNETLYAEVTINKYVRNSEYVFKGFELTSFDDNGRSFESQFVQVEDGSTQISLRISDLLSGDEISIAPIGQLRERHIQLKDFYINDENIDQEAGGRWIINNNEYVDDYALIRPTLNYVVSYEYDPEKFFFIDSEPDSYYVDNNRGIVYFNQQSAEADTVDYSVELHPYIAISLPIDVDRSISTNDSDMELKKANEVIEVPHLKYGDTFSITTNKEWPALENSRNPLLVSTQKNDSLFTYTLCVPEKEGTFLFDPNDYVYEHGTISFYCFGELVTSPQVLAKGSTIRYEENNAEEGYWLSGADHRIIVGSPEDTFNQLNSIHFDSRKSVLVELPQPEYGGVFKYEVNGRRIYDSPFETFSGTEITVNVSPWDGWISNYKNGEIVYIVNDKVQQTINYKGIDFVKDAFIEDEDHKPELTVVLERSVGENMVFGINASGINLEASSYGGGWEVKDLFNPTENNYNLITNDQELIKKKKIGTEKGITISMGNRAIPTGKAVRVRVEKTVGDGGSNVDIQYITDLTNSLPTIEIYPQGESVNGWYKTIRISIGVVDVETYQVPSGVKNATIILKNKETKKTVFAGDLIEKTQNVAVTIDPDNGYYITGKSVNNNIYQNDWQYGSFIDSIDSILDKHPIKKLVQLTLNSSDDFADYTYILDGKLVSESVYAKEGQILELTYVIRDSEYKLEKPSNGFLGFGKNYKEITRSIKIDASMDGMSIDKEDFDITVIKGN